MSTNLTIDADKEKIFGLCDGDIQICKDEWPWFCYKNGGRCKHTNILEHQLNKEFEVEKVTSLHDITYFEKEK